MSPEPYYDDGSVAIYHGDCLDVMEDLEDGEERLTLDIGLILTSPPYNLAHATGSEWARLGAGYGEHNDAMPHGEYCSWQRDVLATCWDLLTDDGAIYYQHKPRVGKQGLITPLELNPGLPLRQIVTWDRGSGFMRVPTYYVPSYEWVLIFAKDAFRLTTLTVNDVWRIPPVADSEHPASFPLKLATTAIGSTAAHTVLDPFMGSGTTLRAAKDLGRKAIGIEIEERYCEIAAKRLAQEVLPL